ncbi:MAG TPA: hypothetical protein PK364_00590 [Synergistaceae bacterium]|nr:hypothetical protein [Synergistaceae bacterium]HPQ37129.1 hypothetical protein [Synergistaceae bacterium]
MEMFALAVPIHLDLPQTMPSYGITCYSGAKSNVPPNKAVLRSVAEVIS